MNDVISDHFQGQKAKGQGHQAALLTAALTRQAAAAGTVGSTDRGNLLLRCGLQARSARRREALRRPRKEERGGVILWRPPRYSLFDLTWNVTVVCSTYG